MHLINHASAETLITSGLYHRGLIIHTKMYRPNNSNKNVDIACSALGAFLE